MEKTLKQSMIHVKKNIHYSKSVIVYILKLITDSSSIVKRKRENKLK